MRVRSVTSRRTGSFTAFAARLVVAGVVPLAVATYAAPAQAQEASPQDIAQARQLGQQAQAAYDAGNYAESEKLWAAAAKLYAQAPTLTLGLARAQAKVGHVVGAQESYNKIIREWSTVASPPPAFKDALEAAKAEVGAVSGRIASVVIAVEGPTSPQVTVDGQPVPTAALGLKRPVDPGQHVVKATAEGYKPAETTFTVAEGGSAEAKLALEKAPEAAAVAAAPASSAAPASDTKSGSPNKTLALVAFGVGGAGLVFGTITGLVALGKHGDLSDQCPDGRCSAAQEGDVDSYRTMGTLSTVGFVLAGVGAAAGAVLWFTAPKESSTTTAGRSTKGAAGPTFTPYLGVGGGGVTGRF